MKHPIEKFVNPVTNELVISRCTECSHIHFPAQDRCESCWATGCETEGLKGEGKVLALTRVESQGLRAKGVKAYYLAKVAFAGKIVVTARVMESGNLKLETGVSARICSLIEGENTALFGFEVKLC